MKARQHNKFSPVEAKTALLRSGRTVTSLAREVGHPRQTVSAIINGSDRYPRLKKKVVEALFA